MNCGERSTPATGRVDATAIGKALPEAPESIFQDEEQGLDETPGAPRFFPKAAPEGLQRPIVPGATINDHERCAPTALQGRLEKQQRVEAGSAGRDVQMNDFAVPFRLFYSDAIPSVSA